LHSHTYFHGVALKQGNKVFLLELNVKKQEIYIVKPAYTVTSWNRLFSCSRRFPFSSGTWFGCYGLHILQTVTFFL